MEKELREIIESKIQVLSEKKTKDGSLYIHAPWIMTGQKNRNGRLYSQPLIQREVASFQDRVKEGSVIGSADHPGGAHTTLDTASHIITKLEVDKNGQGWVEMKILPTSKGKNVIEIIKAKGQLGLSARGTGTVSQSGIVQSDYKLLGIDIVTNPSEPTATFNKDNIFESADFFEEKGDKNMKNMMGLSEEYVDEMMQNCYEIFVRDEGFIGSFEDFKKQWGNAILAEILVSEKKCKNTEEALKHLGSSSSIEERIIDAIDSNKEAFLENLKDGDKLSNQPLNETQIGARVYSYFCEARASGYQGDYITWKKEFPQIVEMAKEAKVVVEKKVENKVPFSSKTTWNEVVASGFTGTQKEFEEQYPDITVTKLAVEKPIVESLDQEAKRIFYELKKDNPNSSLQLEDVEKMLEKEEAPKREKKTRELAIYRVNRSIAGSGDIPSSAILEKMVDDEVRSIKEEREEKKRKNWQAYKRLLSD